MSTTVPQPPQPPPATAAGSSSRKPKHNSADRQIQHRWIQLIDTWHSSSSSSCLQLGALTRDELVEEISHHAQTLCRTIRDRGWLVDAFHFGICAVLFPPHPQAAVDDRVDAEEISRVEQLGHQLLQLAIHSVATPYLRTLQESNVQDGRIAEVSKAKETFERLSRRLSMFEKLRGLTEMIGLPTLPLRLVLEEESATVLVLLASLEKGAELAGPLLGGFGWLVEESASSRTAILGQILTADGGEGKYSMLAESGLLIDWKEGKENSVWASVEGVQMLSLTQLTDFYRGVLATLRDQARPKVELNALLDALAREWQGEDAQQAIAQLRSSTTTPTQSAPLALSSPQPRFNLDSIQSLASQISSAGSNTEAQKQLAKQLISFQNETTLIANQLVQLIDTNDSANIRSFALTVVSEASSNMASAAFASCAAATVYARPAVGRFRFDLNTPNALLKHALEVVSQLEKKPDTMVGETQSGLQSALRAVLDVDEQCFVPACQLLTLLRSTAAGMLLQVMQKHLGWLQSVSTLVEGTNGKPGLDLCWLAAYGGSFSKEADSEEKKKRQLEMVQALVERFTATNTPPSSLGGRPGEAAAGADRELMKFRASWDAFFHRMLELCSRNSAFALLPQDEILHLLLSTVLRTGDVSLFSTLSTSSPTLSTSELEELILSVSTSLFDKSTIASTRSKDIRLSLEVLSALPSSSPRVSVQREFIEAACRLSSFKIKSARNPGQLIEPKEIRETEDKLELIARMLGSQGDAHRSPELVLDLASRLSSLSPSPSSSVPWGNKSLIEARVLAMLSDAATSAEDFEQSCSFCSRLITASSKPRASEAVVELAWKSCYQLSKHPGWEDTPQRLTMLGHAMTLAPAEQLGGMLRFWRDLDGRLKEEVAGGKVFASTKKVAAGIGVGGWSGKGMGDLLSAQGGVAAGLVGSAANLLPISFGPLSYFGSTNTSSEGAMGGVGRRDTATAGRGGGRGRRGEVDERTAKLFDFDRVSGASSHPTSQAGRGEYVDPTERAVRAARAARDFLGWKSEKHSEDQTGGQGGGGLGGFSLSRGVGWLIGDERR